MIQGIDNIGIAVKDLPASISFYEKLGFRVAYRDDTPAAMMELGSVRLYLFQTASSASLPREINLVNNPPGIDHLSFNVPDVDEFYGQLKEAVAFENEPADQSWGARAVSVLDPDGNRLYFLSPLKGI